MRTLALIPARAGSKGIPHKNTRLFAGLPLVLHAVKVGQRTCSETLVSTDDLAVAQVAGMHGATILMRPPELAQDETPMLPVIQHALANVERQPDVIVLLQPTSPTVRRAWYVQEALRLLDRPDTTAIVSVVAIPEHFSPAYAVEIDEDWLSHYAGPQLDHGPTRRQDCPPAYYRDGTVYVIRRETIEAGALYGFWPRPLIIPASDSATLDTEDDWTLAEAKHG